MMYNPPHPGEVIRKKSSTLEAGRQIDISDAQVVAIVEHFNYSFGLTVRLINKELSIEDCKRMQKDSSINLRRRLNP